MLRQSQETLYTEELNTNITDSFDCSISSSSSYSSDDDISQSSELFKSINNKNLSIIDEKMRELLYVSEITSETNTSLCNKRQEYFTFLDNVRQSEYFLFLREKLQKKDKLTAAEYTYYALTTDDVSQLDLNMLRSMNQTYDHQNFKKNIAVLIAALEWDKAITAEEKKLSRNKLRDVLNFRGEHTHGFNELFINLNGINLSGADLSSTRLKYASLRHANLSYANLHGTEMDYADISHADLSYSSCEQPDGKSSTIFKNTGPTLISATAISTCFNGLVACNIDWRFANFTGASFKGCTIGYGCFSKTIFDDCNFENATLSFSTAYSTIDCLFRCADLSSIRFIGIDYRNVDLTHAKLLVDEAYTDQSVFASELNRMLEIQENIKKDTNKDWVKLQLHKLQEFLASSIIFHLSKSGLSNEDKVERINTALQHPAFQPTSLFSQKINRIQQSAYQLSNTLFSQSNQAQVHAYYQTEAIQALETTRDNLIATNSAKKF